MLPSKHFGSRRTHAVGAKHAAGAFTGSKQAGNRGRHVRVDADTALEIVGKRSDGNGVILEKEFHDIVVNAGGEARKITVQFFFQLVRQKREREIHTAVLVSASAVDLLLQRVGQQHLIPFGIERKHGADGLGESFLDPVENFSFHTDAVSFLEETILNTHCSVIALGPMTNLARLQDICQAS